MIQINPDKELSSSDIIVAGGGNLDTTLSTIDTNISNLTTEVGKKITGSGIANNLTTTSSGYALDARQGKALNDKIPTVVTGTITPVSGINIYAYTLVKYGNVVDIELELYGNTFVLDQSTTVARLPAGFFPVNRRRMVLGIIDNGTGGHMGECHFFIETNGYINLTTPLNGFISLQCTYII